MAYGFDFDVAADAAPTFEQLKKDIGAIAGSHGVKITGVVEHGPGGGNPNFFAEAPDRARAREFLAEVYGCKDEDDRRSYCDPALPEEGT